METATGELTLDATAERQTDSTVKEKEAIRRTAMYSGACAYCREPFQVTVIRHETGATCPKCFHLNKISDFIRREFTK